MAKVLFITRSHSTALKKQKFLELLMSYGHNIQIALPHGDENSPRSISGIPIHYLGNHPFDNIHSIPVPNEKTEAESNLEKLMQEIKPDIVHTYHNEILPIVNSACKKLKVPIQITTFRGLGFQFLFLLNKKRNPINENYLRESLSYKNHYVVFQNKKNASLLKKSGLIESSRVRIIESSGVNENDFEYSEEPAGNILKVIMPSRMIWTKGVEDFVNAAYLLKEKYPNVKFRLLGGLAKTEGSISAEQIKAWVDSGIIEWVGEVNEMSEEYKKSNLVVLPTCHGEGISRTLIEASLSGRAVITTTYPGCRNIIKNRKNGIIVKPNSPVKLAKAIEKLINNPEKRVGMGKAGVKIAQKFITKNVAKSYHDLYQELLNGSA